jgi:hypothetical protein
MLQKGKEKKKTVGGYNFFFLFFLGWGPGEGWGEAALPHFHSYIQIFP